MSEFRDLIREILAQELGALLPSAAVQTERVRIESSEDLMVFAKQLLARSNDGAFRAAFESGRYQFKLQGQTQAAPRIEPVQPTAPPARAVPSQAAPAAANYSLVASAPVKPVTFEKSIITERDVATVGADQHRIRIGKLSRLTPLAADELKRRKITIERLSS